jgi:hypothetical protein
MRLTRGLVVAGVLLTAGCSVPSLPAPEDAARRAATTLARDIYEFVDGRDGNGRRGVTAEDLGRRAARRDDAVLLAVSGERRDQGDGVRLTIRVTATGTGYVDNGGWNGETETATVTACFDLVLAPHDPGVFPAACPPGGPITYPPLPKLPGDIVTTLQQRLEDLSTKDEQAVRALLDELGLDPAIRRDIGASGTIVGLALRTPEFDCVMARVGPTQPAQAWRPSRIQLQPGELACRGAEAAVGAAIHPPH